jgi:hypothetical protein
MGTEDIVGYVSALKIIEWKIPNILLGLRRFDLRKNRPDLVMAKSTISSVPGRLKISAISPGGPPVPDRV